MKVVFSPTAATDLEEIGDYIALGNPNRAVSFVREIRERCTAIAAAPEAAPLRDELIPGIRMVVHRNYLVFYRVLGNQIRIERVLHGARDIIRLFREENRSS